MNTRPLDVSQALDHEDPLVRMWAISQGPTTSELSRCVSLDAELAVRLDAIRAINDDQALLELLNAQDSSYECNADMELFGDIDVLTRLGNGKSVAQIVKMEILARITISGVLKEFISGPGNRDLKLVAVNMLSKDEDLLEIVDSEVTDDVVECAWERINAGAKAECLDTLKTTRAQRLAVKAIRHELRLAAVVREHDSDEIRLAALQELTDKNLLRTIAVETNSAGLLRNALQLIEEQDFFLELARGQLSQVHRNTAIEFLDQENLARLVSTIRGNDAVHRVAQRIVTQDASTTILSSGNELEPDEVVRLTNLIDDPDVLRQLAASGETNATVKSYALWRLQSRIVSLLANPKKNGLDRNIVPLLDAGWPADVQVPIPASPIPLADTNFTFVFPETIGDQIQQLNRVYTSVRAEAPLHLVLVSCAKRFSNVASTATSMALVTFPVHEEIPWPESRVSSLINRNRKSVEERNRERHRDREIEIEHRKRGQQLAEAKIAQELSELFSALLDAGVDVNSQDDNGATALHLAMQFNLMKVPKNLIADGFVTPLMEHGASTDILDANGKSVIDVAKSWALDEAKSVLRLTTKIEGLN